MAYDPLAGLEIHTRDFVGKRAINATSRLVRATGRMRTSPAILAIPALKKPRALCLPCAQELASQLTNPIELVA